MDKFIPTYNLEEFKTSNFFITRKAYDTALDLGFNENDIRHIVSTMEEKYFYKSMTSYANYKIWQDVYHVPYENMII